MLMGFDPWQDQGHHSESQIALGAALLFLGAKGTCERIEARSAQDAAWTGASHWICRVSTPLGRRSIMFSQGGAHVLPPTLFDCLCNLSDAKRLLSEVDCAEESLHAGFSENFAQAKRHVQALEKASAQCDALLGPLADACDARDVLQAASDLAKERPKLAGPGKPFGLMHLACLAADGEALARLAQAMSPGQAELLELAQLANASDFEGECAQIATALAEREALAESVQTLGRKAKGPCAL